MAQVKKPSAKDKLLHVWRSATPTTRIGIVLFSFVPIALVLIAISSFTGSSKSVQVEEVGESKLGIKTSSAADKKNNDAVIGAIQDKQKAGLIDKVAKAKTLNEARKGQSSFQSLSANTESSEELSPLTRYKPTQKKLSQPKTQPKPIPKREKPKKKPQLAKKTLSKDVIKELEAPINAPAKKKVKPSTADIYDKGQVQGDPLAGMDSERYAKLLQAREKEIKDSLLRYTKIYKTERENVSSGFQYFSGNETQPQTSTAQYASNNSAANRNQRSSDNGKKESEDKPPMLLMPGDHLIASNPFPVDSRIKNAFIMKVAGGILDDARLRCNYQDVGDFLVPVCNEITFKGGTGKLEATAINPVTLNGIIDQDVDDDLFLKSISRISASVMSNWGTNKIQSGIEITQNGESGNTQQQNTLSDREILLAATATSLGDFVGAAEAYYQSPSVKTIKKDTTMLLVITRPMPDWWGISQREEHNDHW